MHSLIISLIAILGLIVSLIGVALPFSTIVLVLATGVCLIGMPHGSLDHLAFRKLVRRPTLMAMLLFFASYLAIAAAVIAGWYFSPLACVLMFFGLSAWHFGLEEDDRKSRSRLQSAAMIARGGMVIWVPTLFHPIAVTGLLTMVLPTANATVSAMVVDLIVAAAPVLLCLTMLDLWLFEKPAAGSQSKNERWQWFDLASLHYLRVVAFFGLFAIADPLVSFGVYFCGWHSIRGLKHLFEEFGDGIAHFVLRVVPVSTAALLLMLAGLAFWSSTDALTPAVVRTLFIGLSAVAVPHLLLHVFCDLRNLKSFDQTTARSVPGVVA